MALHNTRVRSWSILDPFPIYMEGRTCRVFKEVVFSRPGLVKAYAQAGGLSGLSDTLGSWNEKAQKAPTVSLTTVTLDDLLARAGSPSYATSLPHTAIGTHTTTSRTISTSAPTRLTEPSIL